MQKHVYAVFGNANPEEIDNLVLKGYPEDSYQILSGQWLIRDDTSEPDRVYQNLQLQLPPSDEPLSETNEFPCIITSVSRFYGWQQQSVWDWIEESTNGK
jgi:hypothetical protein